MGASRLRAFAGLLATLVWLVIACGEGAAPLAGGIASPADLRDRTLALPALDNVAALLARYVLAERYGLRVDLTGGDVVFLEVPADSLAALLMEGEMDAALLSQEAAFQLSTDGNFRVLGRISDEFRSLTGLAAPATVLITYRDALQADGGTLSELNSMLAESGRYFASNSDSVLDSLAEDDEVDKEFARWQVDRFHVLFGEQPDELREQVRVLWDVARQLDDIDEYPLVSDVLVDLGGQTRSSAMEGDRATVSIAVLDDPVRRAALYGIDRGITSSPSIDLDISYLSPGALAEAALGRQYDVVEASPLLLVSDSGRGAGLLILSAGAEDVDSTLLFVRAGS